MFKKLCLRSMPKEIYDHLIEEQARVRKSEDKFISLERILYRIVREQLQKELKN